MVKAVICKKWALVERSVIDRWQGVTTKGHRLLPVLVV
jgi:hypothetical protein